MRSTAQRGWLSARVPMDMDATWALIGASKQASDEGAVYAFDIGDVDGNQVPDPCEQNFTYDADGNLLTDENFAYHWDGENRLVMVEPIHESGGVRRVTNTYDYLGRRVRKLTEVYNSATPAYEVKSDVRYVYDGWNVVLELDGLQNNAVQKKYTWGLDLSNSLQGAGGVGGLLACERLCPNDGFGSRRCARRRAICFATTATAT